MIRNTLIAMQHRLIKSLLVACSLLGLANEAYATVAFSFTGSFIQDAQSQFFSFQINGATTVALTTVSYAGGTLADGSRVTGGGFDPYLTLYQSNGLVIGANDDIATDGIQLDSSVQLTLNKGIYWVSLTQAFNLSNGNHYDPSSANNGFIQSGDYTGPLFGCSNGQFCNYMAENRFSDWALNITGAISAQAESAFVPAVPEPDEYIMLLAGASLVAFQVRRKQKNGFKTGSSL